jgi:Pentapeptide repeats (8 copies)
MKYYRGNRKGSKLDKFSNWLLSPKGMVALVGAILVTLAAAYKLYILIHPPVADKLTEAKKEIDSKNFGAGVSILRNAIKDPQRSQWQIVDMLSDGIRLNSKAPIPLNKDPKSLADVPPAVIDALNIIITRKIENDIKDEEYKIQNGVIDLRKTNLHDIDFIGENKNLSKVSFDQSSLYQTNLSNANLRGASLRGTYLRAGKLQGANLEGARLETIKGNRTDLIKVSLLNANLYKSNLSGVMFFDEKLKGNSLEQAKMLAIQNIKGACNWYGATYDVKLSNMLGQSNMSMKYDQRKECQKFAPNKK